MENELNLEQCRPVVHRVLAARGWRLIQNEEAFVEEVEQEAHRRLKLMSPRMQKRRPLVKIIEDATVNRYNHIWYAACNEDETLRQRQAFTELHQYLFSIAFNRANQDQNIAEGATQEALTNVWQNLSKVRDPGSFARWAGVIVTREVSKKLKKALERPEISEADLRRTDDPDANELEILEQPNSSHTDGPQPTQREDLRARFEEVIKHCLKRSKQRQRVIIRLFLDQQGVKQVAEELGKKPSNIHLLKHLAKKGLEKCKKFLELAEKLQL